MSHDKETTNAHAPHHGEQKTPSAYPVLIAIVAVLLIYIWLAHKGLPQKWSDAALNVSHSAETHQSDDHSPDDGHDAATDTHLSPLPVVDTDHSSDHAGNDSDHAGEHAHSTHHETGVPPLWMVTPFCILLLCIAVLPLIPATEHWWENNLHRFYVAAVLGGITLAYYAFMCDFPIALHWPVHDIVSPSQGALAMGTTLFINAIVNEYIAFIVLLFSLFTIAGGIRISGDLKASPLVNTTIIGIGALLASFVGTTAAAMLLIRLLLETNKERKYRVHTIIFFIFCACNCGGCLLPIGDPPLFLGYLRGVNFLWTFQLWKEWLFVNGLVLLVYFLWDFLWFYRLEPASNKVMDKDNIQPLKIRGLFPNLFCLLGVVLAVMFLAPGKPIQIGTIDFNPWMFLREAVQLLMVVISLAFGSHLLRVENKFNYAAIIEVAALFFGIFLCMQAPLQILDANGEKISHQANKYGEMIGLNEPQQFFWMTGTLSAVLDNAPTYLVFFETAKAAKNSELETFQAEGNFQVAQKLEAELNKAEKESGVRIPLGMLVAISLGAVFMGAMTYIGNGPNFMVKAIAEQSGTKMPSFFGYMLYSVIILLPLLILMTVIFIK